MSSSGNQYILVAQDYFYKWPAIPDQKAEILLESFYSSIGPHANCIWIKEETLKATYLLIFVKNFMWLNLIQHRTTL